jgi:hypothetical protein
VAADAEDDNLTDNDLQSEIELVGDLVVAVSSREGRLPQDEVDLLLGVSSGGEPPDVPSLEAGPTTEPET